MLPFYIHNLNVLPTILQEDTSIQVIDILYHMALELGSYI